MLAENEKEALLIMSENKEWLFDSVGDLIPAGIIYTACAKMLDSLCAQFADDGPVVPWKSDNPRVLNEWSKYLTEAILQKLASGAK